jgi:hypothetical protein
MPACFYLFCLARASLLPPLKGPGLEGSPLGVASLEDLAAVYCLVPQEEFSGADSERRLQDLAWMGPRVCRHQEVVEAVMRHSPVLPARFGTLFSSREKLDQVLRVHHDTVRQFLDRVIHQEEWGVKGLLDRPRALEARLAELLGREADRLADLAPGRRYFEEQRLKAQAEKELYRWLREVGAHLAAELQDYALNQRQRRLPGRGGNGSGQEVILNWAFMVPTAAVGGFKSQIEAANRRHGPDGLTFKCTGPWPPYSFSPALNLEADP